MNRTTRAKILGYIQIAFCVGIVAIYVAAIARLAGLI